VRDLPGLLARWLLTLLRAPSLEGHRQAMLDTAAQLRAGVHPLPDAAFALLLHHGDGPVDPIAGRRLVGPPWGGPLEAAVEEVATFEAVFVSPAAFEAHVRAGLDSRSLARRDLSWRLLNTRSFLGR